MLDALVPAVFAAILGLIGVVIGGAITFASSYFIESQKAARERAREEKTRAASLQLAARIVDAEFSDVLSSAQFTLAQQQWPESMRTEMTDWLAHRVTLAAELSGPEWVAVVNAAITMDTLGEVRTYPTDEGGKLFPPTLELVRTFIPHLEHGRDALRPYCRGDCA